MTEIRWGYTLGDLEGLAHRAVAGAHYHASDYRDRYMAAWDAIIEDLYTAQEAPRPGHLMLVGLYAVDHAVRTTLHQHGAVLDIEPGQGRAFQRYWFGARITPSPETRLVEELAREQIWPHLAPRHQRALAALAAHEDYAAAAAALGIAYSSFYCNLRHGRLRFLELWHEGETPTRLWLRDRRVWRRDTTDVADHRPVTIRYRAHRRNTR